ncbi:MAG TPA: rhomboid-like protein [Mycobacteriales bacterium]|nr:rhomboid-like protein [Mycobacteriales bacterium]
MPVLSLPIPRLPRRRPDASTGRTSAPETRAVQLRGLLTLGRAQLARAPLTVGYLVLLAVTTLIQLGVSGSTRQALLAGSSTDVLHLGAVPARVLVASALWLPDLDWFQTLALFALVLAPVEARLGTRRMLVIFLTGHVLATLLTELPVAAAVAVGHLPVSSRARLDVGVSYGLWTVYAVRVWLSRHGAVRTLLVLGAVVDVLIPLLRDPEVTTWGHLASLGTGGVIVLLLRARRRPRLQPAMPHPIEELALAG